MNWTTVEADFSMTASDHYRVVQDFLLDVLATVRNTEYLDETLVAHSSSGLHQK